MGKKVEKGRGWDRIGLDTVTVDLIPMHFRILGLDQVGFEELMISDHEERFKGETDRL